MDEKQSAAGRLFIVGTPLGNLEDITLRALRTLKEVALVAAEDTRVSRKLLFHYRISTPVVSFHQHSNRSQLERLLTELSSGKDIALITDAGMPGISDPGEALVAEAIERGIDVIAIPGPSAVVTALAVSGLPTAEFAFVGFMPRSGASRRRSLEGVVQEPRTLVLFEAPHRLSATLDDLLNTLGDRKAVAARELTKKFEEIVRGRLSDLRRHFIESPPRGEFTLVVEGDTAGIASDSAKPTEDTLVAAIAAANELVKHGKPIKDAAREVAAATGVARRTIYNTLIREQKPTLDDD